MKAIEIFIKHFDGNQSEAARALGKKQQHVGIGSTSQIFRLNLFQKPQKS